MTVTQKGFTEDHQRSPFRGQATRTLSVPELVLCVFLEVQTEFTKWNHTSCRRDLQSSASPLFPRSSSFEYRLSQGSKRPSVSARSIDLLNAGGDAQSLAASSTTKARVLQTLYSTDVTTTTETLLDTIEIGPPFGPHPPYESCSPLHRNVFKGDDDDNMRFIPYADDPDFDQIDHTLCYEGFLWQEYFDPDRKIRYPSGYYDAIMDISHVVQVTVLEAAYRLHTQHARTYDEIERSGALPLKLRSHPGKSGLLSTIRRR